MTSPAFSLCVYCGSRAGADGSYAEIAKQVGRWIGEHDGQLVYGGGNNGLMGLMATAALEAGASVVGVIPHSMVVREWAKRDCTELHIVDNMHQRKSLMAERADAFLALPGGIGTFEEFFEAWTWKQLGFHAKPVGLLDAGGYYRDLFAFLANSVRQGFMSDWQLDLITIGEEVEPLLAQLIEAAAAPSKRIDVSQI